MARTNAQFAVFQLLLSAAQRRHHGDGWSAEGQPLRDAESLQQGRPKLRLPHRQHGKTHLRLQGEVVRSRSDIRGVQKCFIDCDTQ